jgi:hypothetical protein
VVPHHGHPIVVTHLLLSRRQTPRVPPLAGELERNQISSQENTGTFGGLYLSQTCLLVRPALQLLTIESPLNSSTRVSLCALECRLWASHARLNIQLGIHTSLAFFMGGSQCKLRCRRSIKAMLVQLFLESDKYRKSADTHLPVTPLIQVAGATRS